MNTPANFNAIKDPGSYIIYGTADAAALVDGYSRWMLKFKTDALVAASNHSNYLDCFKDSSNNAVGWQFNDDLNTAAYLTTPWTAPNAWYSLGCTWSAANGIKFYKDGFQIGSKQNIVTTWTNPFDHINMAIGSRDTVPAGNNFAWKGNLQHVAMWDTELTPAEMLRVGKF